MIILLPSVKVLTVKMLHSRSEKSLGVKVRSDLWERMPVYFYTQTFFSKSCVATERGREIRFKELGLWKLHTFVLATSDEVIVNPTCSIEGNRLDTDKPDGGVLQSLVVMDLTLV